jgi:hypothetical protein
MRHSLDPKHAEVLMELDSHKTVFPAHWHSFFSAQVPTWIAEYHQVEHDNDYVYLLQMTSGAKNHKYRMPDQ